MKSPKKRARGRPQRSQSEPAVYSVEVICELSGVSPDAVAEYRRAGLISSLSQRGGGRHRFDDEALRTLRRIEHLRTHYAMNLRGLRLTLELLDELEQLQAHLRQGR